MSVGYEARGLTKRIISRAATPIGSQLRSLLIEEVKGGRLTPGSKIPSERELALRYGISRASVRDSIALLISEGVLVRAGVRGTFVAERPPQFAVAAQATRNIVLLANRNVFDFFQFRYSEIQAGAGSELRSRGYNLVLHSIQDGEERLVREALAPGGKPCVDGCLIAGKIRRQVFETVRELGLPVMLIDRVPGGEMQGAYSIRADYISGTHAAMRHLHALGHRDIGFIGFADSQKYRAYCQGLKQLRIAYESDFVDFVELFDLPPAMLAGYRSLQTIQSRGRLPTALLVTDDVVAVGVMEALKISGVPVPEQISVVCFDDLGQSTIPPLTRIRFDREEAGRRAARTLLDIANGKPPEVNDIILPVEFVHGLSTATVNSR